MQKLMLSAAIAALLAAPALAQPDHHGGPDGRPGGQQPTPQGSNYGAGKAGFGRASAAMHGQPQPAPSGTPIGAPPAQGGRPQGGNGGNWHGDRGDHNRPGFNPGDHTRPSPGFDNRPGFRPGDHTRPTPGFNNRPGGRPNYSNFSHYHQAYRADRRFRGPAYRRPPGWYYQRWSFGQILPALFWAQQYWLNDYMAYDLPPPPPGAVWVRYGNDALLIDRYSGEIITIQYDVFY